MEDIIINSGKAKAVLPVQKIERSKVIKENAETNNRIKSSKSNSGQKERIRVDLEKTVEKVKEFAKTFTTKLSFAVDPKSKESVIYVTDKDTGKIIRQIPPEEIQKMTERMDEIVGILYSGRA